MKVRCPKCASSNISQYRHPTGAIWCNDCNHKVDQKEIDKSFYVEEYETLNYRYQLPPTNEPNKSKEKGD